MTSIEKQNQLLPTHPFAAQVSGPSGCGNTGWVKKLLTDLTRHSIMCSTSTASGNLSTKKCLDNRIHRRPS